MAIDYETMKKARMWETNGAGDASFWLAAAQKTMFIPWKQQQTIAAQARNEIKTTDDNKTKLQKAKNILAANKAPYTPGQPLQKMAPSYAKAKTRIGLRFATPIGSTDYIPSNFRVKYRYKPGLETAIALGRRYVKPRIKPRTRIKAGAKRIKKFRERKPVKQTKRRGNRSKFGGIMKILKRRKKA